VVSAWMHFCNETVWQLELSKLLLGSPHKDACHSNRNIVGRPLTCPRASARLAEHECCASVCCIAARQLIRYMRLAAGPRPSPSPGLHRTTSILPHRSAKASMPAAYAACGHCSATSYRPDGIPVARRPTYLEGPLGLSSAALRSHMSTSGSKAATSTDSNSAAAAAAVLSPLR
jgi:hypothetical protein